MGVITELQPIITAIQPVLAAAQPFDGGKFVTSMFPGLLGFVGLLAVALVFLQWKWGKTASENVQLLVVMPDGHGEYELAPLSGGSVTLKNPHNDSVQMWPINKLSTIDVPYPGVGAVPRALQKTIRQVIVDSDDWEPLLNRSPYKEKVASPDVILYIQKLAERVQDADPELSDELLNLSDALSPSPTREMIASPAVLGNLINEKITEAVITVNKETIDKITGAIQKLATVVQTNTFLIGIGVVGLLCIITLVLTIMTRSEVAQISKAIGVVK